MKGQHFPTVASVQAALRGIIRVGPDESSENKGVMAANSTETEIPEDSVVP